MFDISTLWVFINQMETFSSQSLWDKLYLHVINRSFDRDVPVEIQLQGFAAPVVKLSMESVVGELCNGQAAGRARIEANAGTLSPAVVSVVLPQRSVSVVMVELGKGN